MSSTTGTVFTVEIAEDASYEARAEVVTAALVAAGYVEAAEAAEVATTLVCNVYDLTDAIRALTGTSVLIIIVCEDE